MAIWVAQYGAWAALHLTNSKARSVLISQLPHQPHGLALVVLLTDVAFSALSLGLRLVVAHMTGQYARIAILDSATAAWPASALSEHLEPE